MINKYAETIAEHLTQFVGAELAGVKSVGVDPARTGARYRFIFALRKIAPECLRGIDWSPAFTSRILEAVKILPQYEVATFIHQVPEDSDVKKTFTYLTHLDVKNIVGLEIESGHIIIKITGYGVFT